MKRNIFIVMLAFVALMGHAQNDGKGGQINLWGYVVDSFLQVGLEGAKVTLMTADSTVIDTIHTYMYDNNALFHFSLPAKSQDIILKAEQEGYEPACIAMKVKHYKRVRDVYAPWIQLKKKRSMLEQSLDEVVVTASKIKMVWKGDTLVYNADAFNVPEGSMLDGLIRQLPGVTLKENGEIFVNGRKVDYLTLNGTDFFKGNNKMMLNNLPYYTVKNIKVYDKSTDVSQFLGYDAERKDYVMDVVLKREYAVGLTANAEAGGGTAERWMARAFGLRFTDHSRLTVFGNGNNVNQTGRPGEDGEWKTPDPTDGITKHGEASMNLMNEDRYKRWKNELAVTFTDDRNDRQSQQESEYYLQGGGEFAHRGHSELAHGRNVNVMNTFIRNKSTSPVYFASLVGYSYGDNDTQRQDSARVSNDSGTLYRLTDCAEGSGKAHSVFTSNHVLVKLPWGDRLNLRFDGLYITQRTKNLSHYQLDYADTDRPQDLRHRHEPSTFGQYYWQAETEYVFRFPHDWNLDIGYKLRQDRHANDAPSYRIDLGGWLDRENSLDIVTHTKRHQLTTRLYYLKNNAEAYTNFELKLPLTYERGRQQYKRGDVDANVQRHETYFDPTISFTRHLYTRNKYYNVSLTAETALPDITNLVGYESHYDPLNTTVGNPNLKPQHTYKAATYFMKNWPQHDQTLYTYLDASITAEKITPSVSYDRQTGVYTRHDENINGNWGSLSGVTFSRAIDKTRRWHVENALWITYTNIVWRGQDSLAADHTMQRIKTRHVKIDDKLKLSFRASEKFDASLHGGIVHGLSWSNLSAYQNVRVTDFSYGLAAHWSLPFGFQLSSDLSMLHRSGYESSAMNSGSAIWNAQLSKSVCHNRLSLNLIVHDILDCTVRNTWSISSEGYTNTSHNTLPRYAMLIVIYKLHKTP